MALKEIGSIIKYINSLNILKRIFIQETAEGRVRCEGARLDQVRIVDENMLAESDNDAFVVEPRKLVHAASSAAIDCSSCSIIFRSIICILLRLSVGQ